MRTARIAAGGWVSVVVLVVCTGRVVGLEVPLEVVEPAGIARRFAVVTASVPLPAGRVSDVKALRLLDDAGREVYAEFRPLAYYFWRPERSLRWVEVTFAVRRIPAGGRKVFRLRDDGPAEAAPPRRPHWRIMQTRTGVVVITGGARFEVDRQFSLFTRAWVDANRDHRIERQERIIDKSLNHGGVARDLLDRRYTTTFGNQRLEILHRGALRCVVRLSGTHLSSEAGAFRKGPLGLYEYEAILTFRRGRPWVWVDYILKNSPPQPRGSPVMKGYSLVTRLNLGGEVEVHLLADKSLTVPLRQDEGLVLYQDSDGTEFWRRKPAPPVLTDRNEQFRGYRVLVGPVGRETVRYRGLKARGFVELGDARWGMMAGLFDFWQTYPKALEVDASGRVVFHLFPDRAQLLYWLEDQAHVGHRLIYGVFARRGRRWSLEEFARRVTQPVYVRIPPAYAAECGALHDLGPYRVGKLDLPPAEEFLAERNRERARNREFGWRVFGSSWSKRLGPPVGTYDGLLDTDTLFRYLVTGQRGWFRLGLERARHMRDIRAYHVDEVEVFEPFDDLASARRWLPVGGGVRPLEVEAKLRPFLAGRRRRSPWPLPGERHISLDELYNLYLLTGDWKALDACGEVAAAARAYLALLPEGELRPGRALAMCLRALVKYYELVGQDDPRALRDVRRVVSRLRGVLSPASPAARADSPDRPVGLADSAVLLRALAMAWRVSGEEDILDLAMGTGDWLMERWRVLLASAGPPEGHLRRERTAALCLEPLAWLYRRTGDRRYLDTARRLEGLLSAGTRRSCAAVLPYYYRVVSEPGRTDTVPPAAVGDLAARLDGGGVLLTWTAPGDNGREGRARRYQIKCAHLPILERVPPDRQGRAVPWWSARNLPGEPTPAPAGTRQSMRITGLAPGTYYFCLRTWDEAPNLSPISNCAMIEVP